MDLIPFLPFGKERDYEGCRYVPRRDWGVIVIMCFNVIPFFIIALNYFIIWKVAMKMTFKEFYIKESLSTNNSLNSGSESVRLTSLQTKHTREENNGNGAGLTENCPLTEKEKADKNENILLQKTTEQGEKKSSKRHNSRKLLRMAWEMKATKTSVMLLIVYLLCWAPLGILYMIDHICWNCISEDESSSLKRFVVKIISFLSSLLLPIVYCWRTKEFRHELSSLLWRTRSESRTFQRSDDFL